MCFLAVDSTGSVTKKLKETHEAVSNSTINGDSEQYYQDIAFAELDTSKKQCLLSAAPIFLEQGKKFYHCPAEKNAIPSAEREIDILYHAVQFIDYRCRRK